MGTAIADMAINSSERRYVRVIFDKDRAKYAKIFLQGGDAKIILNKEEGFTDDTTVLFEEMNRAFTDMVGPQKISIKTELDSELHIDKYIIEMYEVGKCNFGEFLDRVASSLRVGELLLYFLPKK